MGEAHQRALRVGCDSAIKLEFHGAKVSSDAGLFPFRDLDEYGYAIRLKSNAMLERQIEHLLTRPAGRPPKQPQRVYHSFAYRAESWDRARPVVAKIGWHRGELFPQVGFIVTNFTSRPQTVVSFYNQRGTNRLSEHREW